MDFSTFNVSSAAEKGRVLHFRHPIFGHKLYEGPGANADGAFIDKDDKKTIPITAVVRGYNCETIKRIGKKANTIDEKNPEDAEKLGEDLVDALIVSWQGITRDGEPLPCTRANKVWLSEQNPLIFKQISDFAQDQTNFFGKSGPS